jgi:hypothetical protein
MTQTNIRMIQPDNRPSDDELVTWMGDKAHKYWQQVTQLIAQNYPDVFAPEWLFDGQKWKP